MTGASANRPPVILIVDDEPLLRTLAMEVVEDAGFLVLQAADADEAIVLLETNPGVALLFTDINMPGTMDGLILAHVVRSRWPAIKLLVASGRERLGPYDLPANSCFLAKPYRSEAMITKLRLLVAQ